MSQPDQPGSELRRRRIFFRATHRGTYENDLLLGGFVRDHLHTLTEAELDALEAVLELPDAPLADWLTGRAPIPHGAESAMLHRIRDSLRHG